MPRSTAGLPTLALLIGLLGGALILAIRAAGALEPVELAVYDWLHRVKPSSRPAESRIVLVTVTEQDIRHQGRWPITDATMARALDRIVRQGPRAIGLDIYRDIEVPPGRDALNALLLEHPNIICVTKYGGDGELEIPPPHVIAGTGQVGFNDLIPDPGMVIRRALLFQDHGQDVGYAFALRLAEAYLRSQGVYPEPDPVTPEFMKLGQTTFIPFRSSDGGYVDADAGGYQFIVRYEGPHAAFPSVTLTNLLAGDVDPQLFQDKVVLLGLMAESVPDLLNTPFGMVHGVEVHAHITKQIIDAALEGRGPMSTLSDAVELAWVLAWGLLGGLLGWWGRSPLRVLLGMSMGLLLIAGAGAAALWEGWWIPVVAPTLAWLAPASFVTASVVQRERKERALLRQLFGRHVSEDVAEAIWQQRDLFLREGRPPSQELVATVLFADFKGYTSVSEKLEPKALMSWLNSYLDVIAELVTHHEGYVDDYAGDAIMANFFDPVKGISGQPVAEEEVARHAHHAVRCAVAMAEALQRLNRHHESAGLPTVGMHIGVYTGPVVAGCIGSAQRMKYTAVGDSVNAAARLESLDRETMPSDPAHQACRILIGEATARYVKDIVQVIDIGELKVKGREHPIHAFQVVGPSDNRGGI